MKPIAFALLCFIPASAQTFTSPRLEAVTSWIGNTYPGGKKWVQQDIAALTVTPDGTVFTNVFWEEAGGNCGEYRDGELIRYAKRTHGWGNNGGQAVAANSRYVYFGTSVDNEGGGLKDPQTWPAKGLKWLGISRRPRADISQAAPFEGGKGGKGDSLQSSFLVVSEIPDNVKGSIPGLCADETRVYVVDPHAHEIKIFDAESMRPVANWKIPKPGPLALHPDGSVWLLERMAPDAAACFRRFTPDGKSSALPLAPDLVPTAFCIANDGRILISDDSPAQQIRIYSSQSGKLQEISRFGERGGIAGGTPGQVADGKLNKITALGTDADNNLYVAHGAGSATGSTVLESYRLADSKLNWRLHGLTFVDMGEIDPAGDTRVFTKEEIFSLDHSKPPGSEWSYASHTICRFQFPEDPRLHLSGAGAWIRRIANQPILFVNDMNGERLQIFRFAPKTHGHVAIPSGLFSKTPIKNKNNWPPHQPATGGWLWRDGNGDGGFDEGEYAISEGIGGNFFVDGTGGIWLARESKGIHHLPVQGLDSHGNPRWDFSSMKTFPHPQEFGEVKRLRYDPTSDTLYLGGTTKEHKNQHWKPMGPVIARYDGWLRGAKKLRWQVVLPYVSGSSGHNSCEPMCFDIAGDFLFAPYTGASKKDGVKTGRVEIFRAADGSAVGHLEPSEEIGEIGLQDIKESLTAHRRPDGEFLVMIEDDAKSKIVMYRVKGLK